MTTETRGKARGVLLSEDMPLGIVELTPREAGLLLGASEKKVVRLITTGSLPASEAIVAGKRAYGIALADIRRRLDMLSGEPARRAADYANPGFTLEEAALLLELHPQVLERLIDGGELVVSQAREHGRRTTRVALKALRDFRQQLIRTGRHPSLGARTAPLSRREVEQSLADPAIVGDLDQLPEAGYLPVERLMAAAMTAAPPSAAPGVTGEQVHEDAGAHESAFSGSAGSGMLVSTREAGLMLGCSDRLVRNYVAAGQLPTTRVPVKNGKDAYRIDLAYVRAKRYREAGRPREDNAFYTDPLLTLEEAAQLLQQPTRAVEHAIRDQHLAAVGTRGGRRFALDDVRTYRLDLLKKQAKRAGPAHAGKGSGATVLGAKSRAQQVERLPGAAVEGDDGAPLAVHRDESEPEAAPGILVSGEQASLTIASAAAGAERHDEDLEPAESQRTDAVADEAALLSGEVAAGVAAYEGLPVTRLMAAATIASQATDGGAGAVEDEQGRAADGGELPHLSLVPPVEVEASLSLRTLLEHYTRVMAEKEELARENERLCGNLATAEDKIVRYEEAFAHLQAFQLILRAVPLQQAPYAGPFRPLETWDGPQMVASESNLEDGS